MRYANEKGLCCTIKRTERQLEITNTAANNGW